MSYLTDNATFTDSLDFTPFRAALKEIATNAQTPLTVGVFGAWGSGKTSLMRMVREDIAADGLPSRRTAWFTAWKYDREEALWRAFILRVLDALYPREEGEGPREERPVLDAAEGSPEARLIALLEKLEQSVYQDVAWEEIGPRAVNWWGFLGSSGKAGLEVAATLASFGFFPQVKALTGADETAVDDIKKAAQAISRETKEYHRRQLFHMEEFEATFKEVISLIDPAEDARLIVFVDDLDRCLPEKALQILEAIKLFMDVPGVVFILGMDKSVVQQGIEARYGEAFRRHTEAEGRERELPISGDSYLQKIVQIPFHLPALAMDDVAEFIDELEAGVTGMTRDVFARGLYPNPRQVKRALNIFRLLRTIADERFEGDDATIADPLLAKTVVIQTQFPDLYQLWRQYPTVVQTLETEYSRRAVSEEELLRGRRPAPPPGTEAADLDEGETPGAAEEKEEGRRGLLDEYLGDRVRYALLARLLTYPPEEEAGEGKERARFASLGREQMAAYVRLAGAVEAEGEASVDAPADVMAELLSGDAARVQDAVARLQQEEEDRDGRQREAIQKRLVHVLRDPNQTTEERLRAGDALAQLGDPRFHGAEGFYLPREEMLGFVEIPEGNFRMGSDDQDSDAEEREKPQHTLHLPSFYMARYPVTVAQFRAFVEQSDYDLPDKVSLRGATNHPVVYVNWHDALAYCRWLGERLRAWLDAPLPLRQLLGNGYQVILPSEAEWEKAARRYGRIRYPWGNDFDAECANFRGTDRGKPSAVGCFPGGASPYGLLDMSGNVWEWTRSIYKSYPYINDGREKMEVSSRRVLRGGSWIDNDGFARVAYRSRGGPDLRSPEVGFRLVVVRRSISRHGR